MKKPVATQLNADQQKALEALVSDNNVYLSGAAGTGKSTLINYYKKHHNKNIQVLCSTGLASVLIGGRTFNSFFGIGIMNESLEVVMDRIINNPMMVARIMRTKCILIDEVSMLPGKALDYANYVCKMIRNNPDPFGGIRVIAVGDFFQLPPVNEANKEIDWAFNSITWNECEFKNIELKEFMRTKDEYFLKVLASVRKGLVGPEVTKFLNSKINRDPNFMGTRIYARKAMVAAFNEQKLGELNSPIVEFQTRFQGDTQHVVRLKRNLPIEERIILKVGAFVMVRVNDRSKEKEFVNGTLGHVVNIYEGTSVFIKTLDGRYIMVGKHDFELKDGDGNVIAKATNIPISLAWSISIHKSQGSTLDMGLVDLNNLFASGMAYTALSRLTNSEGLRITGWNRSSIFVDKAVLEFYRKIRAENPV